MLVHLRRDPDEIVKSSAVLASVKDRPPPPREIHIGFTPLFSSLPLGP